MAQKIIDDPEIAGNFFEMGSGPVIQSAICEIAGSSSTVLEGFYPNSKTSQQRLGVPPEARSVSFAAVRGILERQISGGVNTVLVSSWQIPSSEMVDTHGWIGVWQRERGERFYHLQITDQVGDCRARAQQVISEIGLQLLLFKNQVRGFVHCDQIFSLNGESQIESGLAQYEFLLENGDHLLWVSASGQMCRTAEKIREINQRPNLPIFKGSFNPPTLAHMEMATLFEKENGQKPVFMISTQTRDKRTPDWQNLAQRVSYLNTLGYEVLVVKKGGFVENTEFLRKKGISVPIKYLCGADTFVRLEDSGLAALAKSQAQMQIIAERDGTPNFRFPTGVRVLAVRASQISSTQVRTREKGFESLMPAAIRAMYLQNNPQ